MAKFIVAKKEGMTQTEDSKGKYVGVTVLQVPPNVVTSIKTRKKDGYSALQLGLKIKRRESKTCLGHLKKSKLKSAKLKEFIILSMDEEKYKVGQEISLSDFEEVKKVQIQGFSKGLGFQGVIKRHGFRRGPETHGSNHHRAPGAIGQCSSPGRVFPGKKMPGRAGGGKTTIKNLKIIKIDPEKNLLAVGGSVPGKRGSIVAVRA